MKVVQSFISNPVGGYGTPERWMSKVDELASSALQWKYVFPEDTMHLYVGPGEWKYISSHFSPFELNLWDEITVLSEEGQEFQQFSKWTYSAGRFWALYQQADPVLFLDQDTFVWPELRDDPEYVEFKQKFEQSQILGFTPERNHFTKVKSSHLDAIEELVGLGKFSTSFREGLTVNTGILFYNPIIRKYVKKILDGQELYRKVVAESPELLEIVDGGIILEIANKLKVPCYTISSPYLSHFLYDYRVPPFFDPEQYGYGYTDKYKLAQEQREVAWKCIFNSIRKQQRGIESVEFKKLFEQRLGIEAASRNVNLV